MKLVRYSLDGSKPRVGYIHDELVYELGRYSVLEYADYDNSVERHPSKEAVSLEEVRLHAPIEHPSKIIAIGLNYEDHAKETGADIPKKPIVFAKYSNTIIGHRDTICIPSITEQADYEAELAVMIAREARAVEPEEALDYVFGYMNANDVSARDLQFSEGGQWTRSKSLDTFGPLGPYLVTKDEIPDPQDLWIRATLNGEVVQDGSTSKMIFSVAELVSFLSAGMTLEPGDIIMTGTPAGVGIARDPRVFLKDGDEIIIEIQNLGTLTNSVQADR